MAVQITWLGHNCFEIAAGPHRLLLDPFLNDSPVASKKAGDVTPQFILVSHGHFDHIADAASIASRTGAQVLSSFEVCEWLKRQGVKEEQVIPMNVGGSIRQPFGRLTMTIAHHSGGLPDGSYGGPAAGFLLEPEGGKRIYFACDTALFLDMKLIGAGGLDLAVVPIGDQFTMGPEASIEAVKFLAPKRVLPCHYNTWPPIAQDARGWAEQVRRQTAAEPVVLKPGEALEI
jgi:L-ascorbate metabolism protein UlaG (beta-lactamase superfamily)